MRLFLGKFSNQYPEQVEKKYYAAGDKGGSWYGDVEPGDYVFASYEGKIIGLWRAKEYTKMKNSVNLKDEGVLLFDEIKKYEDVNVSNDFTRYKHFIHDLNLVNKVTKSVKGLGFIPIKTSDNCPSPEDIEFKTGGIDIYIALEDINIDFKEGDIRVSINNTDEMKIKQIERYINGTFSLYKEFNDLYIEKNRDTNFFTIKELYNYSIEDNASKKRKFLTTLIEELEKNGYMKVNNAIKLYDNVLVGRKVSTYTPVNHDNSEIIPVEPEVEENENSGEYDSFASLLNFNPNIILYGPPGTGKTYATQRIIDTFEKKYFSDKSSYMVAELEDRVRNVTFHQSYSYEEFIEGIRPVLNEDEAGKVGYKLENGLFKDHCINAEKELIKKQNNAKYIDMIHSESAVWKVSLGERQDDHVFNECLQSNDIAIYYGINQDLSGYSYEEILEVLGDENEFGNKPTQNANTINAMVNEMIIGDIVMVYDSPQTIRMIGVIKSDYRYDSKYKYNHRRSVEWFKDLNYPIDIHKYNGKNLTMKAIYELVRISVSDVIEIISQHSREKQSLEDKHHIRPYYMIIDEINRGNISKIFGELITLIEQDKRGKLRTFLPYSKKEFTVPGNLYIIGTMNTADRSIAAIDTALRRRFTFVEIEPDSNILVKNDNAIINDHVDLTKLMDRINNRILNRFDRDHRIGHAYFMGIESLNNLYQTWYYKILPLLNEYFYNDVETLRYIVGQSFYDEYGNVKYLSTSKKENGLTEFEEKLILIYSENNNG